MQLHLLFTVAKMKFAALLFLTITVCLLQVQARKIPSFIPICKRSSDDFDSCILSATESLRGRLARGIPELRVPALEPLNIPELHLEQGTNAVNYNCTLTNVEVYGLSNYEVLEEKADVVDKLIISAKVKIPNLRLESDYTINGRILLVPLVGTGRFHSNLTNAIIDVIVYGRFVEKKGVKYLENKDVTTKFQIDGASVNFENLFNGDKTLGPTTNQFLNENALDIIQEIRPAVEVVTAHLVNDVSSKVFSSFTYDQLFPA